MSGVWHREQLELRLRAELDKAQEQFLNAAPHRKPEACERFREALDKFTALIVSGELPKDRRYD